jgi:hypothetical protein
MGQSTTRPAASDKVLAETRLLAAIIVPFLVAGWRS